MVVVPLSGQVFAPPVSLEFGPRTLDTSLNGRICEIMSEGPSLEEILSSRGMTCKHLENVCQRNVINQVAVKLSDWKMVGHCLEFLPEELTAIELQNKTEDQRKVALMDKWRQREGPKANYLKLATVLNQRKRNDLVKILCDNIASPGKRDSAVIIDTYPTNQRG